MFNHLQYQISTGGHLTILESVDSTNNYAMAGVRTGLAKHGDAFFAMAQVKGKGQRGKTWVTERGTNIIITLVMHPYGLQLQQQFQFSTAVSLGVHDFYRRYAGDETTIKWPNDIYWRDRKAGGILIENIVAAPEEPGGRNGLKGVDHSPPIVNASGLFSADSRMPVPAKALVPSASPWQWAIIGMGININQTSFPAHLRNAVSLKQITGQDHDVIELARELCAQVQLRLDELVAGIDLLKDYNNRLYKKGQIVKFKKGSRVFDARVKEVNILGELVVVTGTEEYFGFGELEWVLNDER